MSVRLTVLVSSLVVGGAEQVLLDLLRGLDRTRLDQLVEVLQTRCVGRPVSAKPLVQAEGVIAWGVSVG